MADFIIKRNDTLPKLAATLTTDGAAYNLTGASVKLIMKVEGATTPKVNSAATIVDASAGKVEYLWDDVAGDTDTEGLYDCEFEVTDANGDILTFPNGADGTNYFTVEIKEDLG